MHFCVFCSLQRSRSLFKEINSGPLTFLFPSDRFELNLFFFFFFQRSRSLFKEINSGDAAVSGPATSHPSRLDSYSLSR